MYAHMAALHRLRRLRSSLQEEGMAPCMSEGGVASPSPLSMLLKCVCVCVSKGG